MWNCTHFRHPTDEQLRNSDMFRSHIYLKSVPFELNYIFLAVAGDPFLSRGYAKALKEFWRFEQISLGRLIPLKLAHVFEGSLLY